jgi:hypothetical protein
MGFAFPLANAIVQRDDRFRRPQGGRAVLGNTCGALAASILTGFVFLPTLA